MNALRGLLLVTVMALAPAPDLSAQNRPDPRLEGRMLREASASEAAGDLVEAEAILKDLLARQPTSSGAVFSLERVLRSAGRLPELLPLIGAHLAAEPSSSAVRFLELRVLAETGARAELDEALEAWIRAEPRSPDPYREGARVRRQLSGPDEAVALLEAGLQALPGSPVLLIELGDVHIAAGREAEGALAWASALGQDRAQTQAVFRRLDDLERKSAIAALVVAELGREPATVSRLEVGAELALRHGLDEDARTLADAATARLEDREAKGFLNGFGRKAEDLGRTATALWAYQRLRDRVDDSDEGRVTDERMAELALAVGDSATALEAYDRIAGSYATGSPDRRFAKAEGVRLRVATQDAEAAAEALHAFRSEFPEAPETDALSAAVVSRLLGAGERDRAMEILDGIQGPGASLERAFLLLEAGDLGTGILALREAVPELPPAEATDVIQLTLLLSKLSPPAGDVAARAATLIHRGAADESLALIVDGVGTVPLADRPPLLALGARAADQNGEGDLAMDLRRRILADHPSSDEMPDAALRLARAIAAQPGRDQEAIELLETLILDHPTSPIVPDARRELRRLQERGT